MTITPGEIHIWRGDLDALPDDSALLSADERARAGRLILDRHRSRFVAARSALRRLLARYTGCAPGAIAFRYGPAGKPALDQETDLRFNASHSEEAILFAVARGCEVGVDIERIRGRVHFIAIARRLFPADEADALARTPAAEQPALFFRLWTRYEAYWKALGGGLGEPRAFAPGWTVEDLEAGADWRAAVAYEGAGQRIMIGTLPP